MSTDQLQPYLWKQSIDMYYILRAWLYFSRLTEPVSVRHHAPLYFCERAALARLRVVW